jgi:hypothetical protein
MILLYASLTSDKKHICFDLKCNPSYNCFHKIPINKEPTQENIVKTIIESIVMPEYQTAIKETHTETKDGLRVFMSLTAEEYKCSDEVLTEEYRENWLETEGRRIKHQNGINDWEEI